ncbi:MAG: branched-chain amino acid ABC transporter permease [Rubrivivax sp.]
MDVLDLLSLTARAAVSPEAAVLALAAVGLNLHYGYTGLLNFGQAGFMMMGAYGLAIGVLTLGLGFAGALALAMVSAAALALLMGLPTLRLRADYFAIVSLAVTESLRLLFRSTWMEPLTGGVQGLQRFGDGFFALNPIARGDYTLGPLHWNEAQLFLCLIAWAAVVAAVLFTRMLVRSPWGRVIRAIRDNEHGPASLGKPVFRYKMQSLVLGGLIGALAGVVLALSHQDVNPETYLPTLTFFAYTGLVLGGIGKPWGPVIGVALFWMIVAATDGVLAAASGTLHGLGAQQISAARFVLLGVALMLLVMFRPDGLFDTRRPHHAA